MSQIETPEQTFTRIIAEAKANSILRPADWERMRIHDMAVALLKVIERLDERDTEPAGEMTRPKRVKADTIR